MLTSLASVSLTTKLLCGAACIAVTATAVVSVSVMSNSTTASPGVGDLTSSTTELTADAPEVDPVDQPDDVFSTLDDGEPQARDADANAALDEPNDPEQPNEVDEQPDVDDQADDDQADDDAPIDPGPVQPGPYVPPAPLPDSSGNSSGSDGGNDEPTPLDPFDPPSPTICDLVTDDEQRFAIERDVVVKRDVFNSSFDILNCTDAPLELDVKTVPSVTLAAERVTVPAAATSTVAFDIDGDAWGDGSIDFKIQVKQGDCCSDRTKVHGFKGDLVNAYAAATDFAPNPGAGGCNTHCISSALLTPRTLTTDLDIEVVTDTPAEIDVFISEQSPVPNQVGDPAFPGVAPSASSNGFVTQLTATLSGMESATDYHLLVRATDEFGHSTIEHHSFRSVTPVTNDGGHLAPTPGCATGCVDSAEVSVLGATSVQVTAATSQAAIFEVRIGTDPITVNNGIPSIPGAPIRVDNDDMTDAWEAVVTDLTASTTYSIVLTAIDEHGGRDVHAAQFTTEEPPPPPVFEATATIDRIDLTYDADPLPGDAGEISMAWSTGTSVIGHLTEWKMKDGRDKWINDHNLLRNTLVGNETFQPISVWVGERDGKGLGFCEAPLLGLACAGITWEVQEVPELTANEIFLLPQCSTFGYPADDERSQDRCMVTSTPNDSGKYPGFDSVVRYTVRNVG